MGKIICAGGQDRGILCPFISWPFIPRVRLLYLRMSRVLHLLLVFVYAAIGAALAVFLPEVAPIFDATQAALIGVAVFILACLIHEAMLRRRGETAIRRRMGMLRRAVLEMSDEMFKLRDEGSRLRDLVETVPAVAPPPALPAPTSSAPAPVTLPPQLVLGGGDRPEDVVAEVRLLQLLVEQLYAGGLVNGDADQPALDLGVSSWTSLPSEDRAILETVRDALRDDRIEVQLRAIVSLPQRKLRYQECLALIRAEDGSPVAADRYTDAAKRAGLMAAIDNMRLFRSVQVIRRSRQRMSDVGFFCPLSASTLNDRVFFPAFVDFMEENTGLAASVVLSIVFADLLSLPPATVESLTRLAELGFRFAVADLPEPEIDAEALAAAHVRFVRIDAAPLLPLLRQTAPLSEPKVFKALLDKAGIDLVIGGIIREDELEALSPYQPDFGQGPLFGKTTRVVAADDEEDTDR